MDEGFLSRRLFLTATSGIALAGCSTPFSAIPLQVNLGGQPVLATPAPDTGAPTDPAAEIRAGFDPVLRMTVPVRLPPLSALEFVVDTGANRSALAENVATPLGLRSRGRALVHGIGGAQPAETVDVPRLEVGELVLRRLAMPVLSRAALGADGLLGVDALRNRHVVMDFERNEFRIRSRDGWEGRLNQRGSRFVRPAFDPNFIVVPARQRFGQLTIVDAEVGTGLPVTCFLDSGAQSTVGNLALRDAAVRRDPGLGLRTTRVQLVGATGQTISGDLARLPGLRLGGLRIGNLSCVFADLHTFKIWDLQNTPALLIGMDVMRHFLAIELDFGRRMVAFRAPAPQPAAVRASAPSPSFPEPPFERGPARP